MICNILTENGLLLFLNYWINSLFSTGACMTYCIVNYFKWILHRYSSLICIYSSNYWICLNYKRKNDLCPLFFHKDFKHCILCITKFTEMMQKPSGLLEKWHFVPWSLRRTNSLFLTFKIQSIISFTFFQYLCVV